MYRLAISYPRAELAGFVISQWTDHRNGLGRFIQGQYVVVILEENDGFLRHIARDLQIILRQEIGVFSLWIGVRMLEQSGLEL